MQDELFDAEALPVGLELLWPEEKQRHHFTAERVALNQQRYRGIVDALAQGLSMRTICRAFTASHHTVKTIREREPELVATEKQKLSRLLGYGIRLCAEGIIEDLENGVPHWNEKGEVTYRPVPPNVKSITLGILSDKKAALDGEATTIIRHETGKFPSLEEMKRAIEAIPPAAIEAIPAIIQTEAVLQQSSAPAEAGAADYQSGEREEERP